MQQSNLGDATPTPTSSQKLFPRYQQPDNYAPQFAEALNGLLSGDMNRAAVDISDSSNNNSIGYGDLNAAHVKSFASSLTSYPQLGIVIKDEPQPVFSEPVSQIDVDPQERLKLERKRYRNRMAASKCRRRKLERIAKLEDKVKILKGENNELSEYLMKLRDDVYYLKKQVMDHVNRGCHIMRYT
ncbi:UNVERIFIED_CONTAM: hypothetical protein PYX00_005884 [Menopon gallinae]|uniref:BZIP domain-containing protein n=1 Tax=Menopon gallinae TaxID=328185 RepID=A0AAW2HSY5_9NEOP